MTGVPPALVSLRMLTLSVVLAAGVFSALTAQVQSAPIPDDQFVVNDVVVSDPTSSLPDPEFDNVGFQVTWQDGNDVGGNLWVATVDPMTGAISPKNGKGQLLASGLAPIRITNNGPEWVYTATGSQIVFSKIQTNNTVIGRATQVNGQWYTEILPDSLGFDNPIGSKDPADTEPRILYFKPKVSLGMFWRFLGGTTQSGATQAKVPGNKARGGRWIQESTNKGMVDVVNDDRDNTTQLAVYDPDTGITTQITSGGFGKSDPFMWGAPEFNGDLVASARVNRTDGTNLGIFRQQNGVWSQINSIALPSTNRYITSPEPFVYNGRSYVFMVASPTEQDNGPGGEIWIAGIDPNQPFVRKVSDSLVRFRTDPEEITALSGQYVYYTEIVGKIRILHRCDTGLGLPE